MHPQKGEAKMTRLSLAVLAVLTVLTCISITAAAFAAGFQPVPEGEKELYTFDLRKNFYPSQSDFEADLGVLVADISKLEMLKGNVAANPENLFEAYELSDRIIPRWWKLWVYAYLRYAINTEDMQPLETIEKTSGDLESRMQFVKTETQSIDDATLEAYFKALPRLQEYAFAIEEARRYRPHTLSLPEEELLSTLSPYLGSWSEKLYQKMVDRTIFPDIVVGRDTFDVNLDYSVLINSDDRQVREETWKGYFNSMAEYRDIYAFTLVKAIETRNKVSKIKNFRNYADSKFFDLFVSYDDVANYFDEIAQHAYLRKEYERVRQARIKADTGYDTVYIWDRTVQPAGFEKPRFDVKEARAVIENTMADIGEEYETELRSLLDPANRRLDIVGGPNRVQGMFATGYPGAPWQFFSMSYNGYFNEVQGLAHESGHAVHHKMQSNAGVKPIYSEGPSYVTEAVAITSELLVGYRLYSEETDLETKVYYLEQFLEDALGLLVNNMFADLELKMYEGVDDGTLEGPDDFDALVTEVTTPYSIYYAQHPEYRSLWTVVHHYFDVPMYNVNYVFAQALALVFADKIINQEGFVDKYQSLLRAGFDKPAPEIVKERTGIDMLDPTVLTSGFAFIEQKTDELRDLYRQLGIEVD
jgi:oligoendopeptidase F